MTNAGSCVKINLAFAGVAHLVERDLAKVEVASSSLVARSKNETPSFRMGFHFCDCRLRLEQGSSEEAETGTDGTPKENTYGRFRRGPWKARGQTEKPEAG